VTRVRLAAVGLRFDGSRVATRAAFAASIRATLDQLPPAGAGATTMVTFPEHTGLLAMLGGDAGASARAALARGADSLTALTALAGAYGDQLGHYARTFPTVDSPGRLLHLATTDTVVHLLVGTFAEVARERQLWLTVGAALPAWERVTGASVAELMARASDHTDVATRAFAYAATTSSVRNRNLVFAPDGELVAVQDKAYLVPMERDAAGGLGLDAVAVDDVAVAELPFARLASVISKDAWMVDVNDRLDQLGAQLLVQPEAFDRWDEVDQGPGPDGGPVTDLWPPDKFQRGGWWMVQRHPSFLANVAPVLLGALGELRFDGQPTVAVPAPAGAPGLGLHGQPPDEGWAAVGPWWRDPRAADDGDVLAWADLELPERPQPSPAAARLPGAGPSTPVVDQGSLLAPHLMSDGRHCLLTAVAGGREGEQQVVVARSEGARWGDPVPVAPAPSATPSPFDRQWRPQLVVAQDGAPVCVYLGFPDESWDVFAAVGGDRGWGPPQRVDDADRLAGVLRERGHDTPVVIRDGADLVVVWSDLRWPWVLPQVRAARSTDDGRSWSASVRLDGGPTDAAGVPHGERSPAETLGQTATAAASTGEGLVVAWQERVRGLGPRTWIVRQDGGGWSAPIRPPGDVEGPRWRPAIAGLGSSVWLVEEVASPDGGARLDLRYSRDAGRTWSEPVPLDPDRCAGSTQRRAVVVPVEADGAVVVFEDDRAGRARIHASCVEAGEPRGASWRIDDAPEEADARAPTAVRRGDQLVVAWQDTRGGHERVRSLEGLLPTSSGDDWGRTRPIAT
jgi:hypothetical protein